MVTVNVVTYSDDALAGDLSLAVIRLARHLRGRRSDSTVSLTQLSALNTLQREGPMTPGAMAAAERVQPPSMTRVIASLVSLGMVRREPHPNDGRQVIITIDTAGFDVLTKEAEAREAWLRARLGERDEADNRVLRQAVEIFSDFVASSD